MVISVLDPAGDWPQTAAIDRPTRLLLALTQAGEELEEAAAALPTLPPAEAQQLIGLLQRQRLAPWVAYQLEQAGLLAPLSGRLGAVLVGAAARAKQQAARKRLALLHTVACLRSGGIPAVALKGAQLAWQIYPQPWLRPMRDLDLLLPEEQIGPAFGLLEKEGFRAEGNLVRRPEDPMMWRVNDFSLWHPGGDFIELHRSLWFRPGDDLQGDFSLDPQFWVRQSPYRLPADADGVTYLHPTYLSLHCLVHHVLRQNLTMGPQGLVDLQLLAGNGHLEQSELAEAVAALGFPALLPTALTILAGWRQTRWLTAASVPSWVLPLMMTSEQNWLLTLDDRSISGFALQWLALQSRAGRWTGPAPNRKQRLVNLARGVALLPRMASKPGLVEQLRRRLGQRGKGVKISEERQLSPALVLATHQLQERSRAPGSADLRQQACTADNALTPPS